MPSGCTVCRAWHGNGQDDDECGHWCHFAGAEDWHTEDSEAKAYAAGQAADGD